MADYKKVPKRIALLCGQPDEEYQSRFIEGFEKGSFESGTDVCVFAMYQKFQDSELREVGESNIFNLINYSLFDGVAVLADTISTPGVIPAIEKRLEREYKGQVLFIDKKSDRFKYILLKHYDPIYKIVSHLIEDHGYEDIAFVTGKEWHFHSAERLKAYLDCMEDHGLEVSEDRIFYGDFWYSGGSNYVDRLISSGGKMPRAIACANDYMAEGVCSELARRGYKIPEDIAVTGYDSTGEGRDSPCPITSIPVPAFEYGYHVANTLIAMIEGNDTADFAPEYTFFRGGSCGCHCESMVPRVHLRQTWESETSTRSLYSSYNRLLEDMLSRPDFRGVMDMIQTYTFQIRRFDSFNICLNSGSSDSSEERFVKHGYTENILNVLSCGPEGKGADKISYDDVFPAEQMLPALNEKRDHPAAYFFTPLHFDDNGFGYAVISYGDEIRSIDSNYILWLRNVMLGLECSRRQREMRQKDEWMEKEQIVDRLTGLYNFEGFIRHSAPMIEHALSKHAYICITAIDIAGLGSINTRYGRNEGDAAITVLADIIMRSASEGALCCRLGNDEFVVAQISEDNGSKEIYELRKKMGVLIDEFNSTHNYTIKISIGGKVARVYGRGQLEQLVNEAVGRKNGNKKIEQKMKFSSNMTGEELRTAQSVKDLLDENRFKYHFQPIVDAKNGNIFAYEALMRPDIEPYIPPVTVLEYAEHLGRTVDVERATFFNVLREMEEHPEIFKGKKVFINSIPGVKLKDEDDLAIREKLTFYADTVVIELTEQAEIDDTGVLEMKSSYRQLGVQSAVDDYGTGYSNIINLLRYMPDYVKIDRMLLSGIQDNPQKQHFVKSIVKFAHENDILVLSEGVETSAELRTCIELGTDFVQGYYTARPCENIVSEIAPEVREEIFMYATRFFPDQVS